MKFRSIGVEGPIGVGKTSFVELLERKFSAHKVLENIENPFLKKFYEDTQGAAFQAQLFFLLSRYRQLQELSQRDLFRQVTLVDYIFSKDKIFAYLNLDDSELLIYDKLYALLEEQTPKPDLVIFLQAETKTLELLERNVIQFVNQRSRLNELGISTKKWLLFYGPPGTGKTHTIHFLAGALEGHTTLLISAEQIGLLGEYMTLARLLQQRIDVM